ncbi:MAG: hypothetical protein ABR587_05310 [Candidatus Binatia bacterium]
MESAQISGKVFRFLSTMHPSLSKPERKRYAEFDPDKWYPWTADIAGEFTDLMRRSPRDTSFARGLAYAATKGLPEDARLSATDIVAGLPTLPAAFVGPSGSGFEVNMDEPGIAEVLYRGMPGFSNVCIAIAGELTQRLLAVGARGLDVKHAEGCRLQGAEACRFEVRWSADAGDRAEPSGRSTERVFERPVESSSRASSQVSERSRNDDAAPPRAAVSARPAPPPAAAVHAPTAAPSTGNSAEDLFEQLRSRLVDAERQTARHTELESHIAALDERAVELEAALTAAQADADAARGELAELKRRLRELVG